MTTLDNQTPPSDATAERLYAGKFKTVEDLEAGYKNSAVIYDENTTLKKKVDELSSVPSDYQNPSDVELEESRLTDIRARAKESGMTQVQYEKFVRSDKARVDAHKESFEQAKKDLGEEKTNLLKDYVDKHYPRELGDSMMKTFIMNKDARQAALNHRDQLLNNKLPGMEKTSASPGYHVSDDDVKKAYAQKEKTKSIADINRYVNLVSARAAQAQS
jgi:hypothetical protein